MLKRIETFVLDLLQSIAQQDFRVEFYAIEANATFVRKKGYVYEPRSLTTWRWRYQMQSQQVLQSLIQFCFALKQVYAAIEQGKLISKRDLYYSNVRLFGKQETANRIGSVVSDLSNQF